MVHVLYRFRTYVNILMRCGTHSHSIPEECYSNSVHRKLMCPGRIRGFHPHLLNIANSLHPHPKWQYMRIQQFNAHYIVSNNDVILVHSQWLKDFSIVHFPPLINMLKFGGCAGMISYSCLQCTMAQWFSVCIVFMSVSYAHTKHECAGRYA